MATFIAYEPFNMDAINFYAATAGIPEFEFYDDQWLDTAGVTYPDIFEIYWDYGNSFAEFSGPNLVVDMWDGTMVAGTVTGLAEGYWSAGSYWYTLAIHGIAISAAALESAISTPWIEDEVALVQVMLAGADTFILSYGNDLARGLGGNDVMQGYDGNDQLFGGLGNDNLKGQNGNDNLFGEQGKDTLTGGRGNDFFLFFSSREAGDKITDFHNKNGDNDAILLNKAGFGGGLGRKLQDEQFQISATTEAEDRDVRVIFCTKNETLWFDKNGSKAGGLSLIADLQGSADLTHHDILLV